ncbi:rhomboid family intramembrane serine protease [Anatilimnocola sp. NA78]|uniref:rhomboid family intramembrane serine protease n=1 Tax=Anatilimnocola sp. NA78 TaxID=3415683 RepID=UPI003CE52B3C
MRQLTTFKDEATAEKFAAWLITQKVDAHAEQEGDAWALWVREEDHLQKARTELATFQADPNNARYSSAPREAAKLRQQEFEKRERAQRNTIEMSGRWGKGGTLPRSTPITLFLIGASVLVAVLTSMGTSKDLRVIGQLQFSGGRLHSFRDADGELRIPLVPVWQSVQSGEVWRLVTPIFLHFGIMHLVFNMMWCYDLGGQVEANLKSWRFVILVLVIAILSNITEVVLGSMLRGSDFPRSGSFGGMSGVNYGLFGFIYIRAAVLRQSDYILRPGTALIMFVWLFLCIAADFLPQSLAGALGSVANGAHVGGLLVGMALAYVPFLFERPTKSA